MKSLLTVALLTLRSSFDVLCIATTGKTPDRVRTPSSCYEDFYNAFHALSLQHGYMHAGLVPASKLVKTLVNRDRFAHYETLALKVDVM